MNCKELSKLYQALIPEANVHTHTSKESPTKFKKEHKYNESE